MHVCAHTVQYTSVHALECIRTVHAPILCTHTHAYVHTQHTCVLHIHTTWAHTHTLHTVLMCGLLCTEHTCAQCTYMSTHVYGLSNTLPTHAHMYTWSTYAQTRHTLRMDVHISTYTSHVRAQTCCAPQRPVTHRSPRICASPVTPCAP